MPKFRKKPVVIEAEDALTLMVNAARSWKELPKWFVDAYEKGDVTIIDKQIHIHTLNGTVVANREDMVICGIGGELYPCKSDIFENTYEPVEE